ncbi:MAG: endonuclease III [Erysipelotrichaceae bacterium]|nr:endonuclease III [Erysipelotrichaceae bacterium]
MAVSRTQYIYEQLDLMFPQAGCELNYGSLFQLAVAVTLSAQTTDVSVNRVTRELFARYPDPESLAQADIKDLEAIIRSIGLYRNKAANIKALARELVENHNGEVPDTMEELVKLPGIGRKTANVILSEGYKVPAIAVDTHVHRVSIRLRLAGENDTVEKVEEKLMEQFPREQWSHLHHLLIHFGRYRCQARKPQCEGCPFTDFCRCQADK